MKRKIAGMLALLLCSGVLLAQSLRVTADKKGRLGYMNEQGTLVIPCQYQEAHAFKNGIAKVRKGNKYGFIDATGAVIIPLKCDQIAPFDRGVAKITVGKKVGLVAEDGKFVLPPEYDVISSFNCYGKAWLNKGGKVGKTGLVTGGKYGVFDAKEGLLIPTQYGLIGEFAALQGLPASALVPKEDQMEKLMLTTLPTWKVTDTLKTDCRYLGFSLKKNTLVGGGLLNGHGEVLIPEDRYQMIDFPGSGMVGFTTGTKKDLKKGTAQRGYWNIAEQKEIRIQGADALFSFTGNVALIIRDGKIGLINKAGNAVLENINGILPCTEGKIVLFDGQRKVGVIDTLGQVVIPFGTYSALQKKFSEDLIGAQKNDSWGLINANQETVVPFIYEGITSVKHGYYGAMKEGKFGMFHISGTQVIPFDYENMTLVNDPNPTHVWVMKDQLWYNFDLARKQVSSTEGYTWVMNFKDGMAGVRTAELQADTLQQPVYIVDKTNRMLFPVPLPAGCYEDACAYIRSKGGSPLTQAEANRFILYRTRDLRSYKLNAAVPDSDWDF